MGYRVEIWKRKDIIVGDRYRQDYGNLEELADSMRDKGIISPLTINESGELQAGGRRYAASGLAGIEDIPVLVREGSDELDLREIELMENIYRKDMEWHERDKLVARIHKLQIEKYGDNWSGRNTAKLISKSHGSVANSLQMAAALEVVPELSKMPTQKDARKYIEKTHENTEIKKRVEKQSAEIQERHGTDLVKRGDWDFHIEDCFIGMKDLREDNPNNMVNIIECDPPYAIDLQQIKKQTNLSPDELKIYNEISKENYPSFLDKLAKDMYDTVSKNCWLIFWYGPTWHTQVFESLRKAGWIVDDIPGIWVKGEDDSEGNGQTNAPNIYLGRAYEPFAIARKGNPQIIKKGRSNVFNFKPVPPSKKYHPTQRPIALMEEILATFVNPGSMVMVPFLGSGATLKAAYKYKLHGFGWELNKYNKDRFLLSLESDGLGDL